MKTYKDYMGQSSEHIERMWYAVVTPDDNDWGYGSYDLEKAKVMARAYSEDAYIAVIAEGSDPVCIEEIREF